MNTIIDINNITIDGELHNECKFQLFHNDQKTRLSTIYNLMVIHHIEEIEFAIIINSLINNGLESITAILCLHYP